MPSGSLTFVGTGIQVGGHLTPEARIAIERADVLLTLVAEPVAQAWLERLNPRARSLDRLYRLGESRADAYDAMVDEILSEVRHGRDVCVAFYGHPGVFVTPTHDAMRRARDEGFPARIVPGISAEDCLFADLGVDPSRSGCQSYEATDFLVHRRRVEPAAALVLWQVGTVGTTVAATDATPAGLPLLVETLLEVYPADHDVTVYEASPYPGFLPLIRTIPLARLGEDDVTALSTLYVPPVEDAVPDPSVLARLGLRLS